jgi:methyltransferase (TIGR00027 family)
MSSEAPSGVGKTALGMAMIRAQESRRSDRLFDDPCAAAFLAAAPGVFDAEQRAAATGGATGLWGAAFSSHAVIRTRFFDDYLLNATRQGLHQVVLLAAGLDSRAYRLAWPEGVRLFELDLPEMLDFKEHVLNGQGAVARCHRVALPLDLRGEWTAPLIKAGFQPIEPTAWLAEGLLIYLSADEAGHLLTTVGHLSAAGSQVAFEFESIGTEEMRKLAHVTPALRQYAAMWKGGLPDAPGWLAEQGWKPEVHDQATVSSRYGRNVAGPSVGGFITGMLASTTQARRSG